MRMSRVRREELAKLGPKRREECCVHESAGKKKARCGRVNPGVHGVRKRADEYNIEPEEDHGGRGGQKAKRGERPEVLGESSPVPEGRLRAARWGNLVYQSTEPEQRDDTPRSGGNRPNKREVPDSFETSEENAGENQAQARLSKVVHRVGHAHCPETLRCGYEREKQ
jgi:hypothetical protein